MGLWITDDPKADRLLEDDPFALLIGMLLDQQVPTETAFAGPLKLADRMGGLDPARIADASPDEFAALCATPPAVHRFPGSMAGGVAHSAANSSGEASAIRAGSRPPIRSASLSGPAKAVSGGTCWSRSIPISRANGSSSRRRSALGSSVIHSPIAPWCHPRRRVAPRRAQENVSTGRPVLTFS